MASAPTESGDAISFADQVLAQRAPTPLEVTRALNQLRRQAAENPGLLDDLLSRLEFQVEPIMTDRIGAERLAELRRRARRTLAQMALKLEPGASSARSSTSAATTPTPPPVNDDCANATALSPGTVNSTTVGADNDGSASCGSTSSSPDVWFSFVASADDLVAFDTFGSSLDTVISLHSACPDSTGNQELACSDDAHGNLGSLLGLAMVAGDTVLLRVSAPAGATGTFDLTVDDSAGGIAGTVTKETTGAPVAADMTIYDEAGYFEAAFPGNPDGTYLAVGLGEGNWYVRANHAPLLPELWDDTYCPAFCAPSIMPGTPITVAGGLVEDIDFALAPGAIIEGTVSDSATGAGIPGFNRTFVTAYDPMGNATAGASAIEGAYTITTIPGGTYTVKASDHEFLDEVWVDVPCALGCDVTAGDPIEVLAGGSVPDVDFSLVRGGSIQGTVRTETGDWPVSGVRVEFHDTSGTLVGSLGTRSDGYYQIDGLPGGDYYVRTRDYDQFYIDEVYENLACLPSCAVLEGTPVGVSPGAVTSSIDFFLQRRGSVEGTVYTDDWARVQQGKVDLIDSNGDVIQTAQLYGTSPSWAIHHLLPGTYYARVSVSDPTYEDETYDDLGCQPSCDPTQGTPILVDTEATVYGLDFILSRCSASSYLAIDNLDVSELRTYEACRGIEVGEGVKVKSGGNLRVTAGRRVSFQDGFLVEAGGSLAVTIDPDVASD